MKEKKKRWEEISRFFDFVNAYVSKFHLILWILGIIVVVYVLVTTSTFFMVPVLLGSATFYIYFMLKRETGWSDRRIQNLLLYKQVTQNSIFTPLEKEAIDRYFGNKQRKELIVDVDDKKRWMKFVYLLDLLSVVAIGVAIYFGFYIPMVTVKYPVETVPSEMEQLLELLRRLLEKMDNG